MKIFQLVLIIACVELQVQAEIPCGPFNCVNETGVTCDERGERCRCPQGDVGDPRIICADPEEHCLCAIFDDPHFTGYNGQSFHLPLPCQHVITDFTTPETPENTEGCQVVIVGMAFFRDKKKRIFASFENSLDILLVTERTRYTAILRANNTPETTLVQFKRGPEDVNVTETEVDGFFIIEIQPCGIFIKYNADEGLFSILTPVDTIDSAGLCGSCNGTLSGSHHPRKLKGQPLVEHTLDALYGNSPIDGFDTNTIEECTNLTEVVANCPPERLDFAEDFCGPMLFDSEVYHYIVGDGNITSLITAFSDCFELVCDGPLPCSEYFAVYAGTTKPQQAADLVADVTFCSP